MCPTYGLVLLSSQYSLRCCQYLKASSRAWFLKRVSYQSFFFHKTPAINALSFMFYLNRCKHYLKYQNTQFNASRRQEKNRDKWTTTELPTYAPTHITFLSAYTGDLIIGSDLTGDRLFILLTSLHFHINTRERFLLKRKEPIFKHRGKKAPAEKYITLFKELESNWVQRWKAEGLVFVEIGNYTKKRTWWLLHSNKSICTSLSIIPYPLGPYLWFTSIFLGFLIRFSFSSSDILNTCDITGMLQ